MEDGITFGCFLFLSSLFLFFGSRPGTNGIGTGFYQLRITAKWRWSFPVRRIRRMVAIELYHSVAGLMISYEYVRSRNEQCFLPFPFLFSYTVMQPRRSAPKEGDNVTATCDCGRVTAILYSRLATRLRSLAIILPIHLFTITRVHVCNRIPINTIRMPMKPNAGVRALTMVQQWCHCREAYFGHAQSFQQHSLFLKLAGHAWGIAPISRCSSQWSKCKYSEFMAYRLRWHKLPGSFPAKYNELGPSMT
jgi:hypothetical protein